MRKQEPVSHDLQRRAPVTLRGRDRQRSTHAAPAVNETEGSDNKQEQRKKGEES